MMAEVLSSTAQKRSAPRSRRVLVLIAAIGIAPIVASYLAYYVWPRDAHVNYGELLVTQPAPSFEGIRSDGRAFRLTDLHGRWIILMSAPANCDARCERMLYATRQARTIQGSEQDRVVRVWFARGDGDISAELLAQHRGLEVVRIDAGSLGLAAIGDGRIYLIDPLGNWV